MASMPAGYMFFFFLSAGRFAILYTERVRVMNIYTFSADE